MSVRPGCKVRPLRLAGLPRAAGLDYLMRINRGEARFERDDGAAKGAVQGKFDLRVRGCFIWHAYYAGGQRLPNVSEHVDKRRLRPSPLSSRLVTYGGAAAGYQQPQEAFVLAGALHRISEPTQASFNGLMLPVPGMTASVTDWYCPDVSMVMRQDSVQNGVTSTVEVTELR